MHHNQWHLLITLRNKISGLITYFRKKTFISNKNIPSNRNILWPCHCNWTFTANLWKTLFKTSKTTKPLVSSLTVNRKGLLHVTHFHVRASGKTISKKNVPQDTSPRQLIVYQRLLNGSEDVFGRPRTRCSDGLVKVAGSVLAPFVGYDYDDHSTPTACHYLKWNTAPDFFTHDLNLSQLKQ